MSGWRVVPAVLTWKMIDAVPLGTMMHPQQKFDLMLAAAPAFEPDDAMVERALDAYVDSPSLDIRENIRAALKAAFEVKP